MSSRFLNVSPRAYIRQKDSLNVLPRSVKTGYQNELGFATSSFRESPGIVFFSDNSRVSAPYMISPALATQSGFNVGTLVITGSVRDRSAYLERVVSYDAAVPYKEGGNPAAFEIEEELGFPEEIYPGFSSPDFDKSSIVIDISSLNDATVTRISKSESLRDPGGPFYNSSYTGFMYYDKVQKKWVDIGLTDPATGTPASYDPLLHIDHVAAPSDYIINAGDDRFMCQFSSSPYSFVTETPFEPNTIFKSQTRGYDKIGEPTSFFGAPYSPRYHATKNRSISLADYIASPFVVDRISVSLPVRAFRTQSPPTSGSGLNIKDDGFGHDIDNYVFFVYVQNRSNATKDSKQDVSGSIRHLIGKKSFCFVNGPTMGPMYPSLPSHDFGYSYNFNMPATFASSSGVVKTMFRDDVINMTFRPTTFNNFFGTTSKLPVTDPDASLGGGVPLTGSIFVQHFWRGGQIGSGSNSRIISADFISKKFNQREYNRPEDNTYIETSTSARSILRSNWTGIGSFYTSGSGLGESASEVSTATSGSVVSMTPVILFPNDELVFGIESGVNANLKAGTVDQGLDHAAIAVTGSRLIVRSGDAKVVLYGTMIKERKELLPTLNQQLGSDAVHSTLGDDPVLDDFDILDKKSLSGSYIDGIFSGSMLGLSRTRTRLFSARKISQLQRNTRHIDTQSFYYDTFIPDSNVIVRGLENSSFGPNNFGENAVKMSATVANGYPVANDRSSDTLLARPFTFERENGESRQRSVTVSLINAAGIYAARLTGDRARLALYYNGDNPSINVPIAKQYSGAASIRYGLYNALLTSPSYIFRRDKFGQFRDLLETAKFSKLVASENGKDVVSLPVVSVLFVSQSSDIQINPDATQSSNLSFECTSSIPFIDDGIVHNRGSLPTTIARFGPNNLIFGITGSFGF